MVHGGISDSTDLDLIRSLDRGKYVSLLRPPILENALPGTEVIDKVEWKQVSHGDLSASFLPPKHAVKLDQRCLMEQRELHILTTTRGGGFQVLLLADTCFLPHLPLLLHAGLGSIDAGGGGGGNSILSC